MYDDFGDGWNGCSLDLYLDGVLVLDSITMINGAGPEVINFDAYHGQEITTVFTCHAWCYECEYEITDVFGTIIAQDGMNSVEPTGIPAGICYTNCTTMTGINEADESVAINVFPNPANDFIKLESTSGITQIQLLDGVGRILQSFELQKVSEYRMDVSACETAVYYLRIDTEEGRVIQKIVVRH